MKSKNEEEPETMLIRLPKAKLTDAQTAEAISSFKDTREKIRAQEEEKH